MNLNLKYSNIVVIYIFQMVSAGLSQSTPKIACFTPHSGSLVSVMLGQPTPKIDLWCRSTSTDTINVHFLYHTKGMGSDGWYQRPVTSRHYELFLS
jgi:hypothetical protein